VSVKWVWTAVSGVSAGVWTGLDAGYFKEEGLNRAFIALDERAADAAAAKAESEGSVRLDRPRR